MSRLTAIAALSLAALLLAGGPAAAAAESGFWYGAQDRAYVVSVGGVTTEPEMRIYFMGGYTAGGYDMPDVSGGYRFVYGMADYWLVNGSTYPGQFQLLDLRGDLRFKFGKDLCLQVGLGGNAIWGEDAVETYTFIQARGGAALVKLFRAGPLTLTAESGAYFILGYCRDLHDLGGDFFIMGVQLEAGLSARFAFSPELWLDAGVKTSLAAEKSFLSVDSLTSVNRGCEGWIGITWGF